MSDKPLPTNPKQLRDLYDPFMSRQTWWNWLAPIRGEGKPVRLYAKMYRPSEVEAIKALLGDPRNSDK